MVPAFDAEAIHQFRVTYKKLRAFLRMISGEHSSGDIKVSKKLNKCYHIAGSIRDLHLHQQRLLEATKQDLLKPTSYLDLLQKKIEILKSTLSEIFLKKPVTKSKKKTDAVIPGEFSLSAFNTYIQNKSAVITTIIIAGNFSDIKIHSVRKHLKDLSYNRKSFEVDEHDTLQASLWIGKDEKYVTALTDELGNFQDKCAAIALMKPSWLRNLHKLEQEQLEEIKKQWRNEKAAMKKLLVKKLKTDFAGQQDTN